MRQRGRAHALGAVFALANTYHLTQTPKSNPLLPKLAMVTRDCG